MRFHHIVFDPNLLLNVLFRRGGAASPTQALVERVVKGEVTGWISAHSLPAVQRLATRQLDADGVSRDESEQMVGEFLRWLCRHFQFLSLPGQESKELVGAAKNIEEAQIALAASFLGEDTCIATDNREFDTLGKIQALSPQDLLSTVQRPVEGKIDFIDLRAQQRVILPALEQRVRTVFRHGQFIQGPEIRELEQKLAEYVGVQHALCCSSGTDALLLALMAFGVGPGDAILTTPFTFIATAEVISLLGATPVFVDIEPRTFNLDPSALERALWALRNNDPSIHPLPRNPVPAALKPRGILPVDLFGLPADFDSIAALADQHGLFLLEDAAQSFGGTYKGRRAGSFGHAGATSFFPAKPLGCYGDGGAVFTNDGELARKMASFRVHGQGSDKYDNVRIGLNARCDTLQAAILLAKLEAFPAELEARQAVAQEYTRILSACPRFRTPFVPSECKSAWAQYSLLSDYRNVIQKSLKAEGIPTAVYYPKPLHLQSAFSGLGYPKGSFPASEDTAQRIFSLPMHPYMKEDQIRHIADRLVAAATGP